MVAHRKPLIVAGGSQGAELATGGRLFRALVIMVFKTWEYVITMSSSSIIK